MQQGAPPPEKWKNVPQLVQELEEKLARGEVECMICYDQVRVLFVYVFPSKRVSFCASFLFPGCGPFDPFCLGSAAIASGGFTASRCGRPDPFR